MIESGQYWAIRQRAALVDRGECSILTVSGVDATEFLQGQLTNDIAALEDGQGCYTLLLSHKGKVLADMRALKTSDGYLLVTDPSQLKRLLTTLKMYKLASDVAIEEYGDGSRMLSLDGPEAEEQLATLLGSGATPPDDENGHVLCDVGGIETRVVRADHGVVGFGLIAEASASEGLAKVLTGLDITVADIEAAECIRIEAGLPKYGLDMTDETLPHEAGIVERAVSFEKGCYVGQETVARMHYRGHPNRHLRGLKLERPAASGESILTQEKHVGSVGSVAVSPVHGPIALASIRREAGPGEEVETAGGTRAQVINLPFEL